MPRILMIATVLLGNFFLATISYGQNSPAITIGQSFTIHSDLLSEERELLVYLPNGYQSSEQRSYPLFVVLDGRMNFKTTASTIHSLAEGGAIPRMVVIGISNTNRWRDLTPVPGFGIPGTGGGEQFLNFMKGEFMPWAEKNFRLNGFKVFSGHSLGGLTALNVLHSAPELFDAYIALSPTVEWDDGFMVERFKNLLQKEKLNNKMLYLTIADEQMERPYYDALVKELSQSDHQLQWTSELYEEWDDHMSIRITGGYAGIRWVFRDWRLMSSQIYQMTNDEIEAFYTRASEKFKQPRKWGIFTITDAAYWGLYDESRLDRAMELFYLATQRWPDSAYAWSCLGEAYERTGKPEQALEVMEKALNMAINDKHPDIPYFQGMVNRVRAELARNPIN